MLGGFSVAREGDASVRLRSRPTELVLALLALRLGKPTRRTFIAKTVWPAANERAADQSLRTALTGIRTILGGDCLSVDRGTVTLNPELVETDVAEFRKSLDCSLYAGPLLAGMDCEWAAAEAMELEAVYFSSALAAMSTLPYEEALHVGTQALKIDPEHLEIKARLRDLGVGGKAGNAPFSATSFVGRARELQELDELLRGNRLVTITGPGGSGKSRLAAEIGRRFSGHHWYVALADVREATEVADELRKALGIPSGSRSHMDLVLSALQTMEGLLILDNMEHVTEARADVESIIQACPEIRILVTSQVHLDLPQELEYPLGPLSLSRGLSAELSDGARLFIERAAAANPSLVMSEQRMHTVDLLCERLDGIPLALELAAAKARVLAPEQMLEELRDRFAFLSRREGGRHRHRSLKAALDWSFERLPSEAQELLCDLSVFSGGFSVRSLREVCQPLDAVGSLDLLVSHGWVMREPSEGRFRLLESVHEYAAEYLTPSRNRELELRHSAYFLALARKFVEATFGPDEPLLAPEIELESHNLDRAWEWLIEHDPEGALGLVNGINWYLTLSGQCSKGLDWTMRSIERAGTEPRDLLNHGYQIIGNFHFFQNRFDSSIEWFKLSHDTAVLIGDKGYQGLALMQLAQCHGEQGLYEIALEEVVVGIECALEYGEAKWIGAGYVVGCLVCNRMGNHQQALAYGLEAVKYTKLAGYPWGIASALNEVAMAHYLGGDFEGSVSYQEESIRLKKTSNAPRSLALSFVDLAASQLALNHRDEAGRCLREAVRLLESIQLTGTYPSLYFTAANLLYARGRTADAITCALAGRTLAHVASTHAHFQLPQKLCALIDSGEDPGGDLLDAANTLIKSL